MAFDPFNEDGKSGEVVETTLPDGTRGRNLNEPTPFDDNAELAPINDPVADQMAEELIRLGLKDADAVEVPITDTTEPEPSTESVVTPAADKASAAEAIPPVASAETPPATDVTTETPAGYELDFGGQVGKLAFTDSELRDALIRDATFAQKPPETWAILKDIEDGRSVPISRAEYDEYRALKTQSSAPARLSDDDLQYVDPVVAKRIREMEARSLAASDPAPAPAIPGAGPTLPSTSTTQNALSPIYVSPQDTAVQQARLQQINDFAVKALGDFQKAHSLSDEELHELENYAAQVNLVEKNARLYETRDYGGAVLQTDYSGLFDRVLTDAYNTHPKFVQRKIDAEVQRRVDAEQAAIRATNAKRSVAGSIASAPSAATSTPTVAPSTRAETTNAIADYIRQEGIAS